MREMCNDRRFEEIKETKDYIIRATNIDTSEDEMKVLDQICFRLWQLGLTKKNKDEFNKIKNILEEYNVAPEILREVLLKGQMARHNPTLEEVKQEWEDNGFEIISCSKERFEVYKNWIEKGHHTNAKVVIDSYFYIVGKFSNKYVQLLTKTFRAMGKFE